MRTWVAGWVLTGALSAAVAQPASRSFATEGMLVVANSNDTLKREGEGYLTLLHGTTGAVLGTIPDGGITAHEVLVSTDGRTAYLPIYGTAGVGGAGTDGAGVNVIDLATRKQTGSVTFEQGVRPHYAKLGPDGTLFVTNEVLDRIAMVNPKTLKVIATIPTGAKASHNLAVAHSGRFAYTSNVFAGTVSVMDVKARKLVMQVPVATPEMHPAANARHWQVQRIVITNDDKFVLTCDWDNNELVAIDTGTNTVAHRVKMPGGCYGGGMTPDGKYVLSPIVSGKKVLAVDLKTWTVAHEIDVPAEPQEVLVRPDGRMAYVSSSTEKKVSFINLQTWAVERTVDVGYFPDGLGWARLPK